MSNTVSPALSASPLQLSTRSLPVQILAVVLGSLFLAASSYIEVPMVPVPVTMQTFTICMIGALYGPKLGTLTVIAWLGEAMLGLPFLAGGKAGLAPFYGFTAGYLFSFPVMAWFVGFMAERGWNGQRPLRVFITMLAANLFCLAAGWAWLAQLIGAEKALYAGVTPFIIGGILKSALGAALLAGWLSVQGKR